MSRSRSGSFTPVEIAPRDELVAVKVDDAQNETTFGVTKYTTYRITTTVMGSATSCRHRFSEFVALRGALVDVHPGVVVPPLPDKGVVGRFTHDFVEKRRVQLEAFLQRVCNHPIAASAAPLTEFLGWKPDVLTVIVSHVQRVSLPPLDPNETGDPLADAAKLVAKFEEDIGKTRTAVKGYVAKQVGAGADCLAVAQGCRALGDNAMSTVLRPTFGALSDGLEGISRLTKREAEGQTELLLALKTYKNLARAVGEQLKRREALTATIDKTASSLADVQKQCQGYRGKGGREKKVGELEASIEELKRKQTSLREQHALFTRTLKWELDLFHRTKNVDLHRAFAAFGAAHATYSAEITDGWEALSTDLTEKGNAVTVAVEAAAAGAAGQLSPSAPPEGGGGGAGAPVVGTSAMLDNMQALWKSSADDFAAPTDDGEEDLTGGGSAGA
jgi:sorting nexin-1/2